MLVPPFLQAIISWGKKICKIILDLGLLCLTRNKDRMSERVDKENKTNRSHQIKRLDTKFESIPAPQFYDPE